MKTQITKILTLNDNTYEFNNRNALCGEFAKHFFPSGQPLPMKIKVTVTTRCWAYKDAKRIWIRHQCLGNYQPSSWTWEKTGNKPYDYVESAGMFELAARDVMALLGDKLKTLPCDSLNEKGFPIYVRVVAVN